MRKTVLPQAWDMRDEIVVPVPVCRDGHLGANDAARFSKRAGADVAAALRDLEFGPGEVPVHMLAVGCTELFGANRNGDGFKRAACRDFHHTFVKRAKFYRDHASGDQDPNYGLVKWSTFNQPMGRVELIAALNATPEAARRNGGRVADRELEKLASGRTFGVSMGCEVDYDVCSACGHRARNRREYCGSECPGGGLQHKMGCVVDLGGDLHQLHADNPEPSWHDISHVVRNADRIALVTGILRKSAADISVQIGGAELAELLTPPAAADAPLSRWAKLARDLAVIDRGVDSQYDIAPGLYYADGPLPAAPGQNMGQITAALADVGVILPVNKFAELFTGGHSVADTTALPRAVVGVFDRLAASDLGDDNPFMAQAPARSYVSWAHKVASTYSLEPRAIRQRCVINDLRVPRLLPTTKTASVTPLADEVARAYGLYAMAAIERLDTSVANYPLTVTAALLQNRLI